MPQIIVGGNVVLPQCNTVSYSAIVPVGSGTIKLGCTSGPAFISNGGTSKVYYRGNTTNLYCPSSSPCYVALGYVMHSSSCTNSLGGGSYNTLNNNTIVSFLTIANMGYDYCGTYLASQTGGSTTSFSIFWTS